MSFKSYIIKFKQELTIYKNVLADRRTPRITKILLGAAIGYLAMPFDIIPDFIPVLGQIDDIIIVPLLIFLALKTIPPDLLMEHRHLVIDRNS
ncbi:MAG: YkvA family protein [Lentisphaerae bacterium]|nr:YkvA family protein [Lentisphaerota bacterium]